jgi:ketosteroid isomerase-like protein
MALARRAAPSSEQAVLAAQRALGEAIRRGNGKAAERLLGGQFTWIDAAGQTWSRAQCLRDLKSVAPTGADKDVKVTDYGRIAVVTGRHNSPYKEEALFVAVWVKGSEGWRALLHQDNPVAQPDAPSTHGPQLRQPDAPPPACANPCEFVPYEPKSAAERDIIAAFQSLEKAVTRNDADEWAKHMANEFVVYRTRQDPSSKAGRMAVIRELETINAETFVAEVAWMKLWIFGDAAVMCADHVMPGRRRPPYRATRIWVKRDGRWQMALSQQTTIAH